MLQCTKRVIGIFVLFILCQIIFFQQVLQSQHVVVQYFFPARTATEDLRGQVGDPESETTVGITIDSIFADVVAPDKIIPEIPDKWNENDTSSEVVTVDNPYQVNAVVTTDAVEESSTKADVVQETSSTSSNVEETKSERTSMPPGYTNSETSGVATDSTIIIPEMVPTKVETNPKGRVDSAGKYLVDTPYCKIPATNIWPKFFDDEWDWENTLTPDCTEELHFIPYVEEDKTVELKHYDLGSCTMFELKRHEHSDKYDVISKGKIDDRLYDVSSMDMFMADCAGKYNFEANLLTNKDSVQEKLRYWKDVPEKPTNILILGFDSTSRSQLHRSIPKSLKLIRDIGFVEFNGFHSVYSSTVQNFFAYLAGFTEDQYEDGCRPSWSHVVDPCPLIWKTFNFHKYVSLFLDDWMGSFQWAAGVGFGKQPTDYYLHALFKHLAEIREGTRDCVSNETVPDFMLRYTERFLSKFNNTPSFAFTWFTQPMHDDHLALPNMDKRLEMFFQFLQSRPDILENTLIFILGDHGQRYGEFQESGIEGFLERSHVPLLIRVPENLKKKHPSIDFEKVLNLNSDKLLSGHDIYQTLLHTLVLNNLSITEGNMSGDPNEFQTQHSNRSSLFVEVPSDRDCAKLYIPKSICICNTTSDVVGVSNPFQVNTMIKFTIDALNKIVKDSKYGEVCEEWAMHFRSFTSADIIGMGDDYMTVLLKFDVTPDADFEARIKLPIVNYTTTDLEIVGEIARTDSYGETSWCVGAETQEDRLMKNYCHCNEDPPTTTEKSVSTDVVDVTNHDFQDETTKEITLDEADPNKEIQNSLVISSPDKEIQNEEPFTGGIETKNDDRIIVTENKNDLSSVIEAIQTDWVDGNNGQIN